MAASIILIGPSCAGKSTIAPLLAERLGWTFIELDKKRVEYRNEIGYDEEYAKTLRHEKGFPALVIYWKPFDIHCIERVIEDYPEDHVIAFGAGNSVYDDEVRFARAQKALENIPHVIQLLPSSDKDDSIRILTDRLTQQVYPNPIGNLMDVNRTFVGHPSNEALATITFYNAGQTPEETTEAILQRIQSST